jgi:NAD(P)-dependent dehydrogenase (short-subunit alcohol dehydrogenase family)
MSDIGAKSLDKNLFDLSGKVVLVTGAAGIQGVRLTRGLAGFGADIAVVDIDVEGAEKLAADLRSEYGVRAVAIGCDVSSPEDVGRMTQTVIAELGKIDVLHNNAQGRPDDIASFFAPVEDFSFDVWRSIMAVNLDGVFLVAQAVGKHMIERGEGGSIIQVASTYGLVGPDPGLYEGSHYMGQRMNTPPVYAASKAAIVGLTRYLATNWAPHEIRVNTLVPGGIESGQNDTFKANYAARTPLGRMAHRDEMVGAVVYLASDASSYMTGQMMVVDGGWTAW